MKKIIAFFATYPIWANALVLLIVSAGISSFYATKLSFFPEPRVKDIYVDLINLGTSPEEMEESVTIKIEESLVGIAGIDEITSKSYENTAQVHVETKLGYDVDEVLTDVKNAVDQISSFPDNAEKPKVYKKKPIGSAIYLSLYGNIGLRDLKNYAEIIEDDFLETGFISQVSLGGLPDLEISIEVSEKTLQRYGLTINEVSQAIKANNIDVSGGAVKTKDEELLIRARAKQIDPNAIGKIVLRTSQNGEYLLVRDIATIREIFAETPNKTLFNGQPSVAVNVTKLPEEDIIQITDFVKDYIATFNQEHNEVQLSVIRDLSVDLNERIALLSKNGLIGLFLVVAVLGLFLNFRLAFWVAMGIPISFIGMFIFGAIHDITINQISLFGMILVIGILVDDGIVIAENIFTHLEKDKKPINAVIDGTAEVLPAVFTSVLTTIAVFGTFFFLEGGIGETIREMGIVVIGCLGLSLVEAALILPSHLNSESITKKTSGFRVKFDKVFDIFRRTLYGAYLRFALKWRWPVIATLLFLMLVTIGMFKGGIIKSAFFPFIDSNSITVELSLKPGTHEDITERLLRDIDKQIQLINEEITESREDSLSVILATKITIGSSSYGNGGHTGTIDLRLIAGEIRKMETFKISNMILEQVGNIPQAENFSIGGKKHFGKPVSVRFLSKNVDQLDLVKEEFKAKLGQFDALKDITDNDIIGKREINIDLKDKAYLLGLNHQIITNQIRQGFYGQEAQRLQIGTDEVKIWVRYPKEDRYSIQDLERIRIRTSDNRSIPLSELANFSIERGVVNILHFNGNREILIEAEQVNPNEPLGPISDEINDVIIPEILERHNEVKIAQSGQAKSNEKFFSSMIRVVPVVLLLIYLMIAVTFRSYFQPFLVIFMILPGILGAYIGHYIEGVNVVIMSHLGSVALAGVIVNDAVVFIDKYNQNLREKLPVLEALKEAGTSRFRAILLTSITTVVGLYPLIFEPSKQAQFLIPMAITVAYGILFGTLIILGFLPSILLGLNDLRRLKFWIWEGRWPSKEEVEPAIKEKNRIEKMNRHTSA